MKTKLFTLFCFAALAAAVISSAPQPFVSDSYAQSAARTEDVHIIEIPAVIVPAEIPDEKPAINPEIKLDAPVQAEALGTAPAAIEPVEIMPVEASPFTMDNSLFIGDSRTTGLADYSRLEGVDYFADVGMNVYVVDKRVLPVKGFGEVSLSQLLTMKNYDKIYIMLGINEVGYAFEKTVKAYGRLIDTIMATQPDAEIIVQANLHVTVGHSEKSKYVKNEAIDTLNGMLCRLALEKGCHFIDVNEIFDDENGALMKDKSGDGVHLHAKHYITWANWITAKSAEIMG